MTMPDWLIALLMTLVVFVIASLISGLVCLCCNFDSEKIGTVVLAVALFVIIYGFLYIGVKAG